MDNSMLKSNGKNKTYEVSVGYKPRPLQRQVHESLKRFNVLVCHRRFGKSVLAINELIKTATEKSRSKLAYIAPTSFGKSSLNLQSKEQSPVSKPES